MLHTGLCSKHSRTGRSPIGASAGGFTLIEVMVTVALVAILSSIALPAYKSFVQRSRVPVALVALMSYQVRMEQRYQDVSGYANGTTCAVAPPAVPDFTVTCTVSESGTGFTATATGTGPMAGYVYTVNSQGDRATVAHPRGVPGRNCWSIRGATCDA